MSEPIFVKCKHKSSHRKDRVYLGILKYSTYHHDARKSTIERWTGDTWNEGIPDYIKLVDIIKGQNKYFSAKNVKSENYYYKEVDPDNCATV